MGRKVLGITLALILGLGSLALVGCGENQGTTGEEFDLAPFVGRWECEDNPLNDPGYYTGFLTLTVEKTGEFSMYDAEAGNPGIAGKMALTDDDTMVLDCIAEDFDAPPNWDTMKKSQEITYKFKSEEKLYLTYLDVETGSSSTLIFSRVNK